MSAIPDNVIYLGDVLEADKWMECGCYCPQYIVSYCLELVCSGCGQIVGKVDPDHRLRQLKVKH